MDPDGGSINNAIEAFCRKERLQTCINPATGVFETNNYVTERVEGPTYIAKYLGQQQVPSWFAVAYI